jgi:hypothetical protein
VRAHHNGNAKLRRLQRIMSAGRNQAAAHKRHRSQRIHRGQLADGVEQHNWPGPDRNCVRPPTANAIPTASPTPSRTFQPRQTLRMPRRQHHHSSDRLQQPRPRLQAARLLPPPACCPPPPGATRPAALQQPRRLGLFRRRAHVELQISGDRDTRSGRQPMAFSRSASNSLCASTRSAAQETAPKPAQPPIARPGAVGDPRIHHRHRNPRRKHPLSRLGQNSVSASTSIRGFQRLQIRPHRPGQIQRAIENAVPLQTAPAPAPARCAWSSRWRQNTPAAPHPASSPAGSRPAPRPPKQHEPRSAADPTAPALESIRKPPFTGTQPSRSRSPSRYLRVWPSAKATTAPHHQHRQQREIVEKQNHA